MSKRKLLGGPQFSYAWEEFSVVECTLMLFIPVTLQAEENQPV